MKKIFAVLIALASSVAFGATLVPIQLLNPAGSTAGQMLVSSGASTAPAWSNAPTITGGTINNAIIGNVTPTAGTFSNVVSNGQATISNTAAGAAVIKMTGNGATTPNKYLGVLNGLFTIYNSAGSNLLASVDDSGNGVFVGSVTPSQTGGIIGTTTNNNANAGSVGEYVTNSATGTAYTSNTVVNCALLTSLSAGDWDVTGVVTHVTAGGATPTVEYAGISTTNATLPTANTGAYTQFSLPFSASGISSFGTPTVRISLSSASNVYLVGTSQFSSGTMTCNGFIRARRVR